MYDAVFDNILLKQITGEFYPQYIMLFLTAILNCDNWLTVTVLEFKLSFQVLIYFLAFSFIHF